jgi:hypothetical protein
MTLGALADAAVAKRNVLRANEGGGAKGAAPEKAASPETDSKVTAAIDQLVAYVPAEVLAVYVAVVAAMRPTASPPSASAAWSVFYVFLVLTPVAQWLVVVGKLRAGGTCDHPYKTLPLWEMFAATAAYITWVFALPDSPFAVYGWYSAAIAGVAVLAVTGLLTLAGGAFGPMPKKP